MIAIHDLFYLLVIHFICDFIVQTDKQAQNKKKSNTSLLEHTLTYSFCLFLFLILWESFKIFFFESPGPINDNLIFFLIITIVAHTITDYITSRESGKYFEKQNYRKGFMVVGIDQLLHTVQLVLCYIWLV